MKSILKRSREGIHADDTRVITAALTIFLLHILHINFHRDSTRGQNTTRQHLSWNIIDLFYSPKYKWTIAISSE